MSDIDVLISELGALGVTPEDILRAGGPNPRCIQQLHTLATELRDSLIPPGPAQYLRSSLRMLGGRAPLDVLADGGYDEVLNAVDAYNEGGFL